MGHSSIAEMWNDFVDAWISWQRDLDYVQYVVQPDETVCVVNTLSTSTTVRNEWKKNLQNNIICLYFTALFNLYFIIWHMPTQYRGSSYSLLLFVLVSGHLFWPELCFS